MITRTELRLCFILVLQVSLHSTSALQVYQTKCSISESSVVALQWDDEIQQYTVSEDGGRLVRNLEDTTATGVIPDHEYPAYAVSRSHGFSRRRLDTTDTTNGTVLARPCMCAVMRDYPNTTYFCPMNMTHCSTPWSIFAPDIEPVCITNSPAQSRVALVWPLVLISYGILLTCLVCTLPGRNAVNCCLSHIWPGWNRAVIRWMLWRNPHRANGMIRRSLERSRRQLEQRYLEMSPSQAEDASSTQTGSLQKLSLKTRRYVPSQADVSASPSKNDEDNMACEQSCMICFSELEYGERVGDLSCRHVFHVDCLKPWLRRRNVCPLCLRQDIALEAVIQEGMASPTIASNEANGDP